MEPDYRVLLRQHIEAVWGVKLPSIEQSELTLRSESLLPSWRLCTAEIAAGRVFIWRPDVAAEEREELRARLYEVLSLPVCDPFPPGASREVAFRLEAAPAIDLAVASRIARPLTPDDNELIETFEAGMAAVLLQPNRYPLIGAIVDGHLLSFAHSSRRTPEACELGIDTLPHARRRGYALAAAVVWSAAVLQEGLTPIYSALAENGASLKLAVAAGYREFARAVTLA